MAPRRRDNKSSDDESKAKKKNFFKQRYPGFKKKATELSVLCGNSVAFICFGPENDDPHVWPEPQENPHELTQILGKFNALSDQRRKNHACDLYDFSDLKGLSDEDLRRHHDMLSAHQVGLRQRKITILRRRLGDSNKNPPNPQPPKDTGDVIRVSKENATITNSNGVALPDDRLGFDGVYDDLGPLFRGYHETVSNFGSSTFSTDVGVSDSSLFDPLTSGDYFPVDPAMPTDNFGDWDLSCMDFDSDFDFSSPLFTCDDPLGAIDSSCKPMATYQTLFTDNSGSVF